MDLKDRVEEIASIIEKIDYINNKIWDMSREEPSKNEKELQYTLLQKLANIEMESNILSDYLEELKTIMVQLDQDT